MHHLPKELVLLLIAFAIVLTLRFLQKRFPKEDPLFIERFIIASCAGLLLLIATNKLIHDPAMAPLSIPFALVAFVVSVFHKGYACPRVLAPYRTVLSYMSVLIIAFVSYIQFGLPAVAAIVPTLFLFPTKALK